MKPIRDIIYNLDDHFKIIDSISLSSETIIHTQFMKHITTIVWMNLQNNISNSINDHIKELHETKGSI